MTPVQHHSGGHPTAYQWPEQLQLTQSDCPLMHVQLKAPKSVYAQTAKGRYHLQSPSALSLLTSKLRCRPTYAKWSTIDPFQKLAPPTPTKAECTGLKAQFPYITKLKCAYAESLAHPCFILCVPSRCNALYQTRMCRRLEAISRQKLHNVRKRGCVNQPSVVALRSFYTPGESRSLQEHRTESGKLIPSSWALHVAFDSRSRGCLIWAIHFITVVRVDMAELSRLPLDGSNF